MISLESVTKRFTTGDETVVAVNNVSLDIDTNEFVAVMGSSGSGKSTLMNILGCLDTPNAGKYLLAGEDIAGLSDEALSRVRNRHIGFIFQTFHLLPRLSVLENVLLPMRYSDTNPAQAKDKAMALIERVGLSHRVGHRPNQLSGGQRQRVAIARALINSPKVILADEPTGNLDSKTSEDIMALLGELHQSGQTIVMVTHEDDIAEHAQRTIRMKDGQII